MVALENQYESNVKAIYEVFKAEATVLEGTMALVSRRSHV